MPAKKTVKGKVVKKGGKRYFRPNSKKNVRAKSYNNNGSMVAKLGKTLTPFPPVFWTTLTYNKSFLFTQSTPAIPEVRTFNANSAWDPDPSLGGLSARYFKQVCGITAPYRRYRVHASRITVTVWPNQSSSGSGNLMVATIPRRNAVNIASTQNELMERPYNRYTTLTQVGSMSPRKFKNFIKMKTLLGRKDLMDSDDTDARYDENPINLCRWDVYLVGIDPSTVAGCTVSVKLEYFCQFFSLTDVPDGT